MIRQIVFAGALLAAASPSARAAAPPTAAAPAPPAAPSSADILARSKPSDWRPIDLAHTLTLDLASGRVVMELDPAFAPEHAANIAQAESPTIMDFRE